MLPNWMRTMPRMNIAMLLIDMLGIYLSFSLAHLSRLDRWIESSYVVLFFISATIILLLYIFNVFNLKNNSTIVKQFFRSILAVIIGGFFITVFIYFSQISIHDEPLLQRTILTIGIVFSAIILAAIHTVFFAYVRSSNGKVKWMVIGSKNKIVDLYSDLYKSNMSELFHFVFEEDVRSTQLTIPKNQIIGSIKEINLSELESYDGVVIAMDSPLLEDDLRMLMNSRLKGLFVYELADFYEEILLRIPITHLQDEWIAFSSGFSLVHHDIELNIKRLFDIVLSLLLLIVSLPFVMLISLIIFLNDGGRFFYTQKRTGIHGKEFSLYKLRTMVVDADKIGADVTYKNDPRITKIGKIIRKMRFDELPQLINVFKGDMSFIGPRPESIQLTKLYKKEIPYYDIRHMVKPGITGWAQIMHPATDSIEGAKDKLEYDIYYIKNYSLMLDLYISLRTLRVVFTFSGN